MLEVEPHQAVVGLAVNALSLEFRESVLLSFDDQQSHHLEE